MIVSDEGTNIEGKDNPSKELMGEDLARVIAYADAVVNAFGTQFKEAEGRFRAGNLLLQLFNTAVDAAKSNGWSEFHAVEE